MTMEEVILQKKRIQAPEDRMLEIINSLPRIDWRKAWKEVEAERAREHR